MTCKFCDEETYQLCKVETVGQNNESWVIGLCFKHFNSIAKALPHEVMEKMK